jgi:hypothetical protein
MEDAMLFRIVQTKGKQEVSAREVDVTEAANAIENWSSRFTDKPRTRYGMKITTRYVADLIVGEVGKFTQPLAGAAREQFLIERVA